jgi:hypothetical protein
MPPGSLSRATICVPSARDQGMYDVANCIGWPPAYIWRRRIRAFSRLEPESLGDLSWITQPGPCGTPRGWPGESWLLREGVGGGT